jgi:hypothetical protein
MKKRTQTNKKQSDQGAFFPWEGDMTFWLGHVGFLQLLVVIKA